MHTINKNNTWIITQADLKDEINEQWFSQEYWMNQGRLLGANSGRGSAWVIKSETGKWVLRHYFRGGLYAKLNNDRYFWSGLKNTRAYREFKLLSAIQELNLPSPKPIAALVVKQGLLYRNDLIMEHLTHDMTLAQRLIEKPSISLSQWQTIGHTIMQFHHNGIFHSDLNAHNILLSKESVFLIDFDKGRIRSIDAKWQQENMNRLKRSIEKITGESCDQELHSQWQALMTGYRQ